MNEIQVTVRGNVTSEPRQVRFDDGNIVTSFRLASTARRFDSQSREWIDAGTTFLNVNCRKWMASNAASSLSKGQPVIVTGKLRERAWEKNGRSGHSLEIEADGLGHDLAKGISQFSRVVRSEQLRTSSDEQAERMAMQIAEDEEHERLALAAPARVGGPLASEDDDEFDELESELIDLDGGELRHGHLTATG